MKNTKQKSSNMHTMRKLLLYVKPYKKRTLGVILLLLIITATTSTMPLLMAYALEHYIPNKDIHGLSLLGAGLLGLMILSMLLSKIRIFAMSKISNAILIDIRHELFTHIQSLSFKFFDERPVGKILSRVVGDVNSLQNLLNHSIVNLIPNLFTIILVLVMMTILSPVLTLVCLVIMPLLFGAMFFIETHAHKMWQTTRSHRSTLFGFTHEAFSGSKVTQSFATENYMRKRFRKNLYNHTDSFLTSIRFQDLFWPFVDLSRGIGVCTILTAGFFLVSNGSIPATTLLAFIMYLEMLWRPIMNLSAFYNAFITNLSAAERIFDILEIEPATQGQDQASLPPISGKICFDNVTFSYDNDDKHALRNVSFTINPGEKVALVGETGSGKTTITNLISKFYSPSVGSIKIDDLDIANVDTASIRSQMGIMLPDSFLFSSSIKENILYGKLDATDEEVIAACHAVHADEFISELEEGYDTNVNERGSRLSQGQRQLIAFARALIADPKILILDEATANIDTQTERLVQKGIHKLMEGRTSIVIAHRLSTIRDCDKIFVLSHGQIVESGTHEDLLMSKGYYYNLYRAQYKFLDL